jgi:bacterioferritin-associated ferredoxin
MYVCVCPGVTDRPIRRPAGEGVREVHELTMRLGLGSGCGSCMEQAGELLDSHYSARMLDIPILRAA